MTKPTKPRPPVTPEARANMSLAQKGKQKSAEHRQRISESMKGKRNRAKVKDMPDKGSV